VALAASSHSTAMMNLPAPEATAAAAAGIQTHSTSSSATNQSITSQLVKLSKQTA